MLVIWWFIRLFFYQGPFYLRGLNSNPAWISHYIHYKVWDEISFCQSLPASARWDDLSAMLFLHLLSTPDCQTLSLEIYLSKLPLRWLVLNLFTNDIALCTPWCISHSTFDDQLVSSNTEPSTWCLLCRVQCIPTNIHTVLVVLCLLWSIMMMPSHGNIFRVSGPLCGEFTRHRLIPRTEADDAELWCLLWSPSDSLWRHCN